MLKEVKLPKFGLTMDTGVIGIWLKRVGDFVREGEPLFEVETDKATMEVEAFHTGYLKKILVKKGEEVAVNTVIAYIGDKDDEVVSDAGELSEGGQVEAPKAVLMKRNGVGTSSSDRAQGRVNASPLAKRLATELGVDLSKVKGSGPGGRIGKEDVFAAASKIRPETEIETRSVSEIAQENVVEPVRIASEQKLTALKKLAAERIKESYLDAPHIHLEVSVDMTKASQLRQRLNEENRGKVHLTHTDLLVKATAQALKENHSLNATFKKNTVVIFEDINVGIATSTEKGLVVLVLKNADALTLGQIAMMREKLIARVREGKQTVADLSGGTFTITNLGMFGIESFKPILNPGQAAILAVGAIKYTPVADEGGNISVRPIMRLSLACDHRVVDGVDGSKFLSDLKKLIENPEKLFEKDRRIGKR